MTRLSWVSLAAALALTAQAEWTLAQAVGWWIGVAWCWPLAVDLYVVASFRAHRDRPWAIGLMAASVAGAHALPRLWPAGMPPLAAGLMSVVPVLVAWRVHEMPAKRETPTVKATSLGRPAQTPTELAEEEPRTPPARTATTPGTATPSSAASLPAAGPASGSSSAGASAGRGSAGRSGGRRPGVKAPAARQPALTDEEALEIGVRVLRDAQPATQADYVKAFRAVRGGDTAVIKRSYAPAREAAAKPQLVAIGG